MILHKAKMTKIIAVAVVCMISFTGLSYGASANETNKPVSLQEAKEMAIKNKFNKSQITLQKDKLSLQEDSVYTGLNNSTYGQTQAKAGAAGLEEQRKKVMAELSLILEKENNGIPLSDLEKAQKASLQTQIMTLESQLSGLGAAINGDVANPLLDSLEAIRIGQKALEDSETLQNMMLGYTVETQYVSLLNFDKQIRSLEKNLESMERLLKIERLRNSLGLSNNIDLEKVFFNVNQLKMTVDQAKEQKEIAYVNFKKFIGYPMNEALTLQEIQVDNVALPNYEQGLKDSLENGIELKNAKNQVSRQESYISSMKDRYPRGAASLDVPKLELKDAQLALEDTVLKTELNYKTAYSDLAAKKEKLDLAVREVNLAQKAYETEKTKYEIGMTSKFEYDSKQTDYEMKQLAQQQAAYDYFKSQASYDMARKGVLLNTVTSR